MPTSALTLLLIDTTSVVVTNDTKAVIKGGVIADDTDPNDVVVTFTPDNDFVEGAVVTVTISPAGNKIEDLDNNEMAEDSWSFTVIAVGVESASLGEIKASFTDPAGDGSTAPGTETIK